MHRTYYIDTGGEKDGPHDLVTVMRRVRSGKIAETTPIYIDDAKPPLPAGEIPEIASFFREEPTEAPGEEKISFSLYKRLLDGWHFTLEHNVMTVYAGGLLLISFMLAVLLVNSLGWITGSILAWCIFVTLHNTYLLFVLRLFRGQTLGPDFINHQLAPVLGILLASCLVLALMMAGGFIFLIVPCVIVTVLYLFVPFLIVDRRIGLVEAMKTSRLLLQRQGRAYVGDITCLIMLHLLSLLLIIPIPLTLPLFAAAISQMYEELSAS